VFKFIHISDVHLPEGDQPLPWPPLDKRLLAALSLRAGRRRAHAAAALDAFERALDERSPDLVCVTGDLVHAGLPEEVEAARRWLASLARRAPVAAVPGNHDANVAETLRLVSEAWAPWMGGGAGPARFPYLVEAPPLAFIGLNSARPTAPFLAGGSIDAAQLQALEELLDRTGRAGRFRVVLVHHPPQPGADSLRRRLWRAEPLRQALRERGAELVLHGHLGRPARALLPGPCGCSIPVFGAGSVSSSRREGERRAHFHEFRGRRTGSSWQLEVCHVRYAFLSGSFEQMGPPIKAVT